MDRLEQIREAERKSHTKIYTSAELFADGTWLKKPIRTVTDLLPELSCKTTFRGLDLGCGVGRNCIPVAQYFSHLDCRIDCVDILDVAIERLTEYSPKYGVSRSIRGFVSPLEDFPIQPNAYDLILGISTLEHAESEAAFWDILNKVKSGTRPGGLVCLVINSGITETDTVTKASLPPQFEVNIPTEKMKAALERTFQGWEILKHTVTCQQYKIPRENPVELHTNVVTLVARKP